MRQLLTALALVLAGPAWSQTSWSSDKYTVTSDRDLTAAAGGSFEIFPPDLPYAFSNSGITVNFPTAQFNLEFSAAPGYILMGEDVEFVAAMTVDSFDAPTDMLTKAYGQFTADINGQYALSRTSDGGTFDDAGAYVVDGPSVHASVSATTFEGVACPLGEGANDCNFGLGNVFLDSLVDFSSFNVTPILVAIPELDMRDSLLAGLCLVASAAMARRHRGRSAGCPR